MVKDGTLTFGNCNWLVLEWKDDGVLINTEEIIELCWFYIEFANTIRVG